MTASRESPFADSLGVEILETGPDRCVTALSLTDAHTNSLGLVHGGVIFTLADRAMGLACGRDAEPFVTMDMSVRYIRPARAGQRLTAIAEPVHKGKRTTFVRIDVRDESGRLVACLSGTAHVLSPSRDGTGT